MTHSRLLDDARNITGDIFVTRLLNTMTGIVGVVLILLGVLWKSNDTVSVVSISVGASLIASAVVSYLITLYIFGRQRARELTERWGLRAIYETRQLMNQSCDSFVDALRDNLDIVAFGLRSFRHAKGDLVKDKVTLGLKVRMLCIHPDSEFLKHWESAEGKMVGSIREDILQLEKWVSELQSVAPQKENVAIKFYNGLPLDFYFRVDDALFVGPYMYGVDSQQTISMEYKNNGERGGFGYYGRYFEKLWAQMPEAVA